MKTVLLNLVLIVMYSNNILAQVSSSCQIQTTLQNNYAIDVKEIALRRIYLTHSPDTNSIIIPQSYQDSIMQGLAAIYNLSVFERDSVFDHHCIHQSNYYINYQILVSLSNSCPWLYDWEFLSTPTGVPALDSLLSTYGFTVTNFSQFSGQNIATLTTTQSVNIKPVYDSIATFQGVIYAEPNPIYGSSGRYIAYSTIGDVKYFDFAMGWGDCYSGCLNWHKWQYKVNNDCSVEFLGTQNQLYSQNEPYPLPLNCNITNFNDIDYEAKSFKVYPNPVKDIMKIEEYKTKASQYKIINSIGELVKQGRVDIINEIQIGYFPQGVYLIKLQDDSKKFINIKFIKE